MSEITLSEFADRVNAIMPMVLREFLKRQSNELSKCKITIPQLFILDFLYKKGESRMTDLAHSMCLTTAAMTGIVDRLVKYGYAVRLFQPQDRRIIKIKVTLIGQELLKKINAQKRQMIMRLFGKISQTERQEYLKILTHIHEILIKEKEP